MKASFHPVLSPPFIRCPYNRPSATACGALAAFGALPDKDGIDVRAVIVSFNSIVRRYPDDVADVSQDMEQDGDRIGLGVRLNGPHRIACQSIVGGFIHDRPLVIG